MSRPKRLASPRRAKFARLLTLVGYFGLILLLVNWFTWIAPPERVPRALLLIALAGPLLIPLRGLLSGRRYTHQWVNFLALFYFCIGVDVWYTFAPGQRWLGVSMTAFSLMLFVGSVLYSRFTPSPPVLSAPPDPPRRRTPDEPAER